MSAGDADTDADADEGQPGAAGERAVLLNAEARRWHAAGRPRNALPLAQAALRIVEQERGSACVEAVDLCLGLSTLHEQLSEYDAAEAYAWQAAWGAATGTFDGRQQGRLCVRVLAHLASLERVRGRIDSAEQLYPEALELAEAEGDGGGAGRGDGGGGVGGDGDGGGAFAAADQAALASLLTGQGEYEEAEALYRHVLGVFERAYGPNNHEIAVTCNGLGALMAARGDVDSACSFYLRALRIKRGILGADHAEVALTRRNLAAARAERVSK